MRFAPGLLSSGAWPARRVLRQERGGILVSRILHQGRLPELHSTEDQDDEP